MTAVGEVKQITANITRLIHAEGKNGEAQWEVQLRWPWTPTGNKGGDKTWVAQADFPQWTASMKGAMNLEVVAAYVKKAAEGKEPFDGRLQWMWHWNIRKVLDHAPAQTQHYDDRPAPDGPVTRGDGTGHEPPPEYRQPTGQDALQTRIAWNSAVNNACHLLTTVGNFQPNDDPLITRGTIIEWASLIYTVITAGPPREQAQADATETAEVLDAGEPPQTPPQPAKAPQTPSPERLGRLNGARRAGLARHQWPDDYQAGNAIAGFAQRQFQGRTIPQLNDAELDQVVAAIVAGRL
jgi:hypothetical protein